MSASANWARPPKSEATTAVGVDNDSRFAQLRVKYHSLKITSLLLDAAGSYSDHPLRLLNTPFISDRTMSRTGAKSKNAQRAKLKTHFADVGAQTNRVKPDLNSTTKKGCMAPVKKTSHDAFRSVHSLIYWRAMRILGGSVCGWLVRNGLMSSPPRRVYLA